MLHNPTLSSLLQNLEKNTPAELIITTLKNTFATENLLEDALFLSVTENCKKCFRTLLNASKNQNNTTTTYFPIVAAGRNMDIEFLQILIEARADLDSQDKFSDTALTWAAFLGFNDHVKLLLAAKANHLKTNSQGNTALHEAVDRNRIECIETLLAHDKTLLEIENKTKTTPFQQAISSDNFLIVRIMFEHGAKIHSPSQLYRLLQSKRFTYDFFTIATFLLHQQQALLAKERKNKLLLQDEEIEHLILVEKLYTLHKKNIFRAIDDGLNKQFPTVLIDLIAQYNPVAHGVGFFEKSMNNLCFSIQLMIEAHYEEWIEVMKTITEENSKSLSLNK
jgi:ankyrin repeat protein